ncbi:MAG: hypothetical protein HS111_13030 [Kofleriaceae bacterium]|nr:hypothetical protein [Kofleriaceae bacterium]
MLALRIQLLTGRYVATARQRPPAAEWPPHPARVFSALVATHGATERPIPRRARRWRGSRPRRRRHDRRHRHRAARRDVVDVFAPVNDAAVLARRFLAPRLDAVDAAEAVLAGLAAGDRQVKRATTAVDKARAALAAAIARAVAPSTARCPPTARASPLSLLPDRRARQARTPACR